MLVIVEASPNARHGFYLVTVVSLASKVDQQAQDDNVKRKPTHFFAQAKTLMTTTSRVPFEKQGAGLGTQWADAPCDLVTTGYGCPRVLGRSGAP